MNRYCPLLIILTLTASLILPGCTTKKEVAQAPPPIPGLSGTLAAQTLTARDNNNSYWQTPDAPRVSNSLAVYEVIPTLVPTEIVDPGDQDVTISRTPSESGAESCDNQALFVEDITVPDWTKMKAGQSFVKTWRFQNVGTCTWTPEYQLIFVWGENMARYDAKFLGTTVIPQDFINISLELTAPRETNFYQGNWMFMDTQGNRFGTGYKGRQFFWVAITVGNPGGSFIEGGGFGDDGGGGCKGRG